ncbi:alpha subunit of pyruvate dehydrogenase [Gonapodya sp. JEL0774]|nr:alpha subunit of pyruvate dehydrogenase [Gonapodya sp. JEL0774]
MNYLSTASPSWFLAHGGSLFPSSPTAEPPTSSSAFSPSHSQPVSRTPLFSRVSTSAHHSDAQSSSSPLAQSFFLGTTRDGKSVLYQRVSDGQLVPVSEVSVVQRPEGQMRDFAPGEMIGTISLPLPLPEGSSSTTGGSSAGYGSINTHGLEYHSQTQYSDYRYGASSPAVPASQEWQGDNGLDMLAEFLLSSPPSPPQAPSLTEIGVPSRSTPSPSPFRTSTTSLNFSTTTDSVPLPECYASAATATLALHTVHTPPRGAIQSPATPANHHGQPSSPISIPRIPVLASSVASGQGHAWPISSPATTYAPSVPARRPAERYGRYTAMPVHRPSLANSERESNSGLGAGAVSPSQVDGSAAGEVGVSVATYIADPTRASAIHIAVPLVLPKSYGSEKRFLVPAPKIRLTGSAWTLARNSPHTSISDIPQIICTATLEVTSTRAALAFVCPITPSREAGVSTQQDGISDTSNASMCDKWQLVEACEDGKKIEGIGLMKGLWWGVARGDGEALVRVKVKTETGQLIGILDSTSLRLSSSTRYLCLGKSFESFLARSERWDKWQVIPVSWLPGAPPVARASKEVTPGVVDLLLGELGVEAPEGREEECVQYGASVVLRHVETGITSVRLLTRKVIGRQMVTIERVDGDDEGVVDDGSESFDEEAEAQPQPRKRTRKAAKNGSASSHLSDYSKSIKLDGANKILKTDHGSSEEATLAELQKVALEWEEKPGWFLTNTEIGVRMVKGRVQKDNPKFLKVGEEAAWFVAGVFSAIFYIFGRGRDTQYYAGRFISSIIVWLMGWKIEIEGKENLGTPSPAVFCSNHQGTIDMHIQAVLSPRNCVGLAKRDLLYIPLLNLYLIFKIGEVNGAEETLKGTRSNSLTPSLLPLKKGAFRVAIGGGYPIVPIVVQNYSNIYSPKANVLSPGTIRVRVLKPIETKGLEVKDMDALIEKTTKAMKDIFKPTGRTHIAYHDTQKKIVERYTFAEFAGLVAAIARTLHAAPYNVKPNDMIGIAGRNSPEWMAVWWAIQCLGACAVHLNAFLNGSELSWCVTHADVRILFGDDDRLESLKPFQKELAKPLFHLGGIGACLGGILQGALVVFTYKWDPAEALEVIEKEKISAAFFVPTMAQHVLNHPDRKKRDLKSLLAVSMGAMNVNPELNAAILSTNSYGASETLAITYNGGLDFINKPDSVGPIFKPVQVKIVNPETGLEVKQGEAGDVWQKAAWTSFGYFKNLEGTKKQWKDGWYNTQDIGLIADDGFLYLKDRSKVCGNIRQINESTHDNLRRSLVCLQDMIIRGGENIASSDVENVIESHPMVQMVFEFDLEASTYESHLDCPMPPLKTSATKADLLSIYRSMVTIRRIETAADALYKSRMIRGFCHLSTGQEAIAVGMDFATTREDAIITAYRCHGIAYTRGCTPTGIIAELMGRVDGVSLGKGGSMHMYNVPNHFYGGNGIVGAQIPIGAGLALSQQFKGQQAMTFTMYGDGAANQGQAFEAYNMAALWKLPVTFVCENNMYGMGTRQDRAAKNTHFYTRCEYIPGLRVNGMDVLAVRDAAKLAREWCISGRGPLLMEFVTYRYGGHSMSDPGTTYRSREEINYMRSHNDCITGLKNRILDHSIATEEEIKEIDKAARKLVDEAVEEAKKSPEPPMEQLYKDVWVCFGKCFDPSVLALNSLIIYSPHRYVPGSEVPSLRGVDPTDIHVY